MAQSANLNVMIATARKAGRALAKDFREVENLQISVKGAVDFVSRADIFADKIDGLAADGIEYINSSLFYTISSNRMWGNLSANSMDRKSWPRLR